MVAKATGFTQFGHTLECCARPVMVIVYEWGSSLDDIGYDARQVMENLRIIGVNRAILGVLFGIVGGAAMVMSCTVNTTTESDGTGGSENAAAGAKSTSTTPAGGGATPSGGSGGLATTTVFSGAGNGSTTLGSAGTSATSSGGTSSVLGLAGATWQGNAGAGAQLGTEYIVSPDACGVADPGNDTRETVTPYALGTSYRACLQTETDVDRYEITLPATPVDGGVVQISLMDVETTGNMEFTAYVVSDSGVLQSNYSTDRGANVYGWFAGAAGSKYHIAVYRHWADSKPTAYTLKTTFVPVNDTFEPNDLRTDAKPISVGTAVQGYFFAGYLESTGYRPNAWEDWYKVTLATGASTITLDPVATDVNASITLYDNLAAQVKTGYETTDGSTVVMTYAATAGDYYLKIEPHWAETAKGNGSVIPQYVTTPYSLKVTQ